MSIYSSLWIQLNWLIFFDGDCPLCKREADFLQSMNKEGSLRFIDINSFDFSLNHDYGITYKQAMERIHAVKSDGSIIKDIKVFQEACYLIEWGWIYAPTKLPIFDNLLELVYGLWAN